MDMDICRCQSIQKVGWICEDGGHDGTSPWMGGPLRVPSWHFSPCPADISEQVNKIKYYVYSASSKLFAGSTKCS